MRDLVHNFKLATAIPLATYATDFNGPAIDLQDFSRVAFAVEVGDDGVTFDTNNNLQIRIQHSDNGTDWDFIGEADLLGFEPGWGAGGFFVGFATAHPSPTLHKGGYIGDRRYVRLVADFTGTHGTGTAIAAQAILADPRKKPVA
jgi:hypothetical protein